MKWVLAAGVACALIGLDDSRARQSSTPRSHVEAYLARHAGFSSDDWRHLLQGRAVARVLDAPTGQDVSVFGAVRIATPADRLLARLQRIDELERRLGVLEVGRFSDPPVLDDLAGLTLEDDDLRDLSRCRIGDCQVQLTEQAIDRLHTRVDWGDAGARETATRIFREMIFDRLRAYRAGGFEALQPYADRRPPTPVAPEFARIVLPSDVAYPVPALVAFVERPTRRPPDGAQDHFYWNKAEFGMKPTTRLNHMTIYRPPASAGPPSALEAVIVTRQLYANHYFSATLEWRTVIADDTGNGAGFFLLYATRSRVTGLDGLIGSLLRPVVKRRARSGMERYLTRTRTSLEADAR